MTTEDRHWTHHSPAVRAIIEREVAKERERITQVSLPLDRVQAIVDHLIGDGTRDGLILGNELNVAMGASARRRAARIARQAGTQ